MPVGTTIKSVISFAEAAGVTDLCQLGVSMAERAVEERGTMVEVAEIHASDYHLKLDDAIRWLEEDGLKTEAVIVKPDIAFKDCIDMEVVGANYKLGQKVKPGTRIIVKYVTVDVVKASRKIYREQEKTKAKEKQDKIDKIEKIKQEKKDKVEKNKQEKILKAENNKQARIAKAEKNKEKREKTVATVQNGLSNTMSKTKNSIGGLFSKTPKNKKKEGN